MVDAGGAGLVVAGAVAWFVSLVARDAERWGWAKLKDGVLDTAFNRGLERVSTRAMDAAIRRMLGPTASPREIVWVRDVLDSTWPQASPYVEDSEAVALRRAAAAVEPSIQSTIADRIERGVRMAMAAAGTPVLNLPAQYEPTSSLANIAFEIGTHVDEDVFVEAFVSSWVEELRREALVEPALQQAAQQVEHETTRSLVETVVQTRIGRQLEYAVQVLTETSLAQAEMAATPWFEFHIDPVDERLDAIYADYVDGFTAAARGLTSPASFEQVVPQLHGLRMRALSSRINVRALASALDQQPVDTLLSDSVLAYAAAVRAFLHGANPATESAVQTWYSTYIDQFTTILGSGGDPHERTRYTAELPPDVGASLRRTLMTVAQDDLPRAFEAYKTSYHVLRLACRPL